MSDPLDHRRLLDDIDAEVRRRRDEDGVAEFERGLAGAFARFAPGPAVGQGFDDLLQRAELASFVDAQPPITSGQAAVRKAKGLVHRAVAWEVRHVAMQVSSFASTVTEAVRVLGSRVAALEGAPAPGGPAPAFDSAPWVTFLAGVLAGAARPVVVPEERLALALAVAGVTAEAGGPEGSSLGGLVVVGDGRTPAVASRLAATVAGALAPGGTVVVLGTDPAVWAAARTPVEADLAGPRPLHAATWRVLLVEAGLEDAGSGEGGAPGTYAVVARRPTAT